MSVPAPPSPVQSPPHGTPQVTLKQVAAAAGVHVSTVSRSLDPQRRHLIGDDMAQRVEAAARKLGYRPNRAAAALRTGRSMTVGVLLPDITNPVFPPILRGIEAALAEPGYVPLVLNAPTGLARDAAAASRSVAERLLAQGVDGVIVATASDDDPALATLRKAKLPLVLVNRALASGEVAAVVSDDELGMALAVEHLAALGHAQIAHLAGPQSLSTGVGRLRGLQAALAARGLVPAPVAECSAYSREAGRTGCEQLLAQRAQPSKGFTSIVAANDLLALGAYDALAAAGLRVPQDVSVVGHNDMPLVDLIAPPLTTIRIQHFEMGFQAAKQLLAQLAGEPLGPAKVVLRPELVVRGSTVRV